MPFYIRWSGGNHIGLTMLISALYPSVWEEYVRCKNRNYFKYQEKLSTLGNFYIFFFTFYRFV